MDHPTRPVTRYALLLLLLFASVVSLSSTEPPSPAELLARSRAAAGGAAWDSVRTLHASGRIEAGGLSGTLESWEDVAGGRWTNAAVLGPASLSEGFDGRDAWFSDTSGQATVNDGGEDRMDAANEAYRVTRSYWFPGRRAAAVEGAGERAEGDRRFQALKVHPEEGRPFELWIDRETGLFDRIVEAKARQTSTTFFSDYRAVDGLVLPFRLRSTTGDPKYDQVVVFERIEVNPEIEASRFEIPRTKADDFEIAGGKASTTLPFELANHHVYAEVLVDGRPVRVIVDTGGLNVLTPEAAERLGLGAEGAFEIRGVGESSSDVGLTRVRELRLGEALVRDQVFYVLALGEVQKAEGVDFGGIVGFEVFQRFVVRIDYENGRLTLTDPEAFPEAVASGTAVPFTFDDRTPQVEGSIDGIPGRFSIDTGSRASLSIHTPFARAHGLLEKHSGAIEAVSGWGVGGSVRSRVTRLSTLELGGVRVPAPVVDFALSEKGALADPHLAGNVGGGVLQRFTVTFDYPRQRMILEPNGRFAATDPYDRAGLWLNREGEAFLVIDVVAGGPAAEAGLRAGDTVVAVDGKPAPALELPELRRRLRESAPGTAVRFTVASKEGEEKEVSVRLRDLIPAP
jgi:hypothetical protein